MGVSRAVVAGRVLQVTGGSGSVVISGSLKEDVSGVESF